MQKLTMSDVRTWNKRAGHHFFDPKTMKFFKSRVVSSLLKGNYFITSEKYPHNPTHYTLRQYNPKNHTIATIQSDLLDIDIARLAAKMWQKGNKSPCL